MSIWTTKLKDLFAKGDKTEKLTEEEKKYYGKKTEELNKKLDALANEYEEIRKSSYADLDKLMPEEMEFVYREYGGADDGEIRETAEREFTGSYGKGKSKVEETYEKNRDKLESGADKYALEYDERKEEIADKYRARERNDVDSLIRKGIARSTIAREAGAERESAKASELDGALKEVTIKLDAAEKELKRLETERKNALKNLDLSYAAKVADKIAALEKERDRQTKEVTEFNNKLKEKEADYIKKRALAIENIDDQRKAREFEEAAKENKYGYTGDKRNNYVERYETAYEFYKSLPEDLAFDLAKNNASLERYLGKYYSRFLNALKADR